MNNNISEENKIVSVLIPYYKGKKYIEETILSIKNQTYNNIEIIVVNDSPNDKENTQFIADLQKKYDFKLIHHKYNMGLTKALMTAFENSSGDYISIIGQDDLFLPNKTKSQVEIFENNPDVVYISGLLEIWDMENNTTSIEDISKLKKLLKEDKIFPKLYRGNCIEGLCAQAQMVKREIIEKEFMPLWAKLTADVWPIKIMLLEKYSKQIYLQQEPVTRYRLHNNNTIKDNYKMLSLHIPVIVDMCPKQYKKQAIKNVLKCIGINIKRLELFKTLFYVLSVLFIFYILASLIVFIKIVH